MDCFGPRALDLRLRDDVHRLSPYRWASRMRTPMQERGHGARWNGLHGRVLERVRLPSTRPISEHERCAARWRCSDLGRSGRGSHRATESRRELFVFVALTSRRDGSATSSSVSTHQGKRARDELLVGVNRLGVIIDIRITQKDQKPHDTKTLRPALIIESGAMSFAGRLALT